MGAGGLGSLVGGELARGGHEVVLVARGEHRRALEASGLSVRSPTGDYRVHPRCVATADAAGAVDVAILAVKAYSLDSVVEQTAAVAREGAVVLPLLNGVDTAERLQAGGVPGDRLVHGVAYLTAFRTAPGEIRRQGTHGRILVGPVVEDEAVDDRAGPLRRVRELFEPSSIEAVVSKDIQRELWEKMAVVCSLSVLCCLADAPIGDIRGHAFGADLQARAIAEVLAVGRGRGVSLHHASEAAVGATLDGFPEGFFPSVLHDLRAGGRTEMDALAGSLARMGREVGVETPLLDAATLEVALREARHADGGTG